VNKFVRRRHKSNKVHWHESVMILAGLIGYPG